MKVNKNKLKNFNLFQYLNKNKNIILIFFIIFLLLGLQHSVISMYFDDYGNASLSYSYWVQNVEGTNYTISQLLEWAQKIYNNWGGRILYAILFIIPLLKHGITAYMFIQTFVITGIIFFSYKIVKYYSKNEKYTSIIPIILFILYTCIDMVYLKHGIYWASASVLYVWPLLPMLFLIYFYITICNKINNNMKFNKVLSTIIIIIFAFLTTFSQEQIGVGLLGFIFFYIIFNHRKNIKKYLVVDLPMIITTVISYIILFVAPGNWVRMDTNVEFSKMSFIEKIIKNYPETLKNMFLDKDYIYMYILCFMLLFMIYKVYKQYKNRTRKILILSIPVLSTILEFIIMHFNIFTGRLFILNSSIWLISFFIISIIYFNKNKIVEFCSFEVCAIGLIFCLIFSPVLGGRTSIPYIFFIILISTKFFIDVLNDEKFIKIFSIIVLACLCFKGTCNYIYTYFGYRENYVIMKLNDNILESYNGNDNVEKIKLYKVRNSWYGSSMPYEVPSMNFWIKEYYNIPQKVEFEWEDIYEKIR